MIDEAGKYDSPQTFAAILRIYLDTPKAYSLSMNAQFLDRIRIIFSFGKNSDYPKLTLKFLEMIVASFGESIRHGLTPSNIGVDVAAEERLQKCMRCRNALMQIRLNSVFLTDRLCASQQKRFENVLQKIDSITKG